MVDLSINSMVDLSSSLCVNVYQRLLFLQVSWLWFSSHPVRRLLWRQTGQVAVLHKASSLCAVIVLARADRPHTAWGRNRNEERTWWTHAIFRKKNVGILATQINTNHTHLCLRLGWVINFMEICWLWHQNSWDSHSWMFIPSKSGAASVEKPIPNPWNHVFLENWNHQKWEMNETTRNFETWEMIETLKTWEMVMKPPTCCHTKSLVAHQIVNLHGTHQW